MSQHSYPKPSHPKPSHPEPSHPEPEHSDPKHIAREHSNRLRDFYTDPAVPASSGPDRARRQAKMLAQVLAGVPDRALILDVGCGDGYATQIAAQRNGAHRFVGLDWSAPSLARAKGRGLTVFRAELDTGLPVKSASVDVVVMSEVIEHLVDTDSAAEEACRVLKPGGTLLLSTPNLAAWYNRGLLAIGVQPVFSEVSLRSVYGRPGSQVAGHLHMFTKRGLVEFLAAYGLRTERIRGARYHDVPGPLRPLDRLFCYWPSAASILLVQARKA